MNDNNLDKIVFALALGSGYQIDNQNRLGTHWNSQQQHPLTQHMTIWKSH